MELSDSIMYGHELNKILRKKKEEDESILIKNLGSQDIVTHKEEPKPEKVESEKPKLDGIKVLGKIELEKKEKKPDRWMRRFEEEDARRESWRVVWWL